MMLCFLHKSRDDPALYSCTVVYGTVVSNQGTDGGCRDNAEIEKMKIYNYYDVSLF